MVGRDVNVLFEKKGRLEGQLIGKSDYLHAVHVQAPEHLIGEVCQVRIDASAPNSLSGQLVADFVV